MTATIADLQILINADTSGASKAVGDLDSQVKGNSGSIIKSAVGMFAAFQVGDFLKGAIGTAASFETSLDRIGAVGGQNALDKMNEIKAAALSLGASTSFSASEAAAGMEEMLKAGMSVDDVLNGGAEAALNLAAASGVAVPDAAALMSTTMNVMGVSAEKAADTMVAAAAAAAMSVEDWGYAMKSVGPVAASLGMNIDDLAKYLVVLSNAGINGEQAGTALRNMMLNLSSSTSGAQEAMAAANISFKDASGALLPMDTIITNLAGSWGDLSTSQQEQLAQTIAGKEGMAAFLTLMNGGTAALDDATAALANQASASEQAQAMTDNLQGAWDAFMGTIETIIIVLLSQLLPALRFITDTLNKVANAMLTADWSKFGDGIKGALKPLRSITKGLQTFVKAGEDLVKAFQSGGFKGAFKALFGDIGKDILRGIGQIWGGVYKALGEGLKNISTGIGPLDSILHNLGATFELVGGVIQKVFSGDFAGAFESLKNIGDRLSTIGDTLKDVGKNLMAAFEKAVNSVDWNNLGVLVGEKVRAAFQAIDWSAVGDTLKTLGKVLLVAIIALPALLGYLGSILIPKAIEFIQGFIEGLGIKWSDVESWLATLGSLALTAVGDLLSWLIPKGKELLGGLMQGFVEYWPSIKSWMGTIGSLAVTALGDLLSWLTPKGMELLSGLLQGFINYWPSIMAWLGTIGSLAITALGDLLTWLVPKGMELLSGLLQGFINYWPSIMAWLATVGTLAVTAIGDMLAYLVPKGVDLLVGLFQGLINYWPNIVSWLGTVGSLAIGAIGDLIATLTPKGVDLLVGLLQGLINYWPTLKGWLGTIGALTLTAIGDLGSTLTQKGVDLLAGLWKGILSTWASVSAWLSSIPSMIQGAVGDLSMILWSAGSKIMGGLLAGINSGWEAVKAKLDWITSMIPSWKGPMELDARLLTPNGQTIMGGLIRGIKSQIPALESVLGGVTSGIPAMAVGASAAGSYTAPASSRQTNVYLTQHNTIDASSVEELVNVSSFINGLETERPLVFGNAF